MGPHARDFSPDPRRSGWSIRAIPGGELRAETAELAQLEELGLLDLARWRGEGLEGDVVQRKPDRWVRRIRTADAQLFAKYRRGARKAEWLEELAHVRKPLSAAAREERAGVALERVGVRTPHFVLSGEVHGRLREERESFLVSRELVGFDPIERLPVRDLAPGLRELVRRLADARVEIPDLYAKHLFARGEGDAREFALVDLARVEPATRRSARALVVRHAGALAATLPGLDARDLVLDRPELEEAVRARAELVRARKKLPLSAYARSRYVSPDAVAKYRARSPRRHQIELELLARLLPERIDGPVLDAPCGAGRITELLSARGGRVVSLDASLAMAREAARASGSASVGDLEHLPLVDGACAGAVCFRFLHHVPPGAPRERVLGELARISRTFVVVSFFHPMSSHHVMRRARTWIGGAPSVRFACTLSELERLARRVGWRVDAHAAQSPFLRELWIARLVRA